MHLLASEIKLQWNLSNPDPLGTEGNVVLVELSTNVAFGTAQFIEVSLFQGVLIRAVPL